MSKRIFSSSNCILENHDPSRGTCPPGGSVTSAVNTVVTIKNAGQKRRFCRIFTAFLRPHFRIFEPHFGIFEPHFGVLDFDHHIVALCIDSVEPIALQHFPQNAS